MTGAKPRVPSSDRHADTAQTLGIVTGIGEIHSIAPVTGEGLEGAAAIAPIVIIGGRDEVALHAVLRFRLEDVHQAGGIVVRKGADEDGLDDAEDGGVGADAEGERGEGDGVKGRLRAPGAEGVAEVVPEGVEGHRI